MANTNNSNDDLKEIAGEVHEESLTHYKLHINQPISTLTDNGQLSDIKRIFIYNDSDESQTSEIWINNLSEYFHFFPGSGHQILLKQEFEWLNIHDLSREVFVRGNLEIFLSMSFKLRKGEKDWKIADYKFFDEPTYKKALEISKEKERLQNSIGT